MVVRLILTIKINVCPTAMLGFATAHGIMLELCMLCLCLHAITTHAQKVSVYK